MGLVILSILCLVLSCVAIVFAVLMLAQRFSATKPAPRKSIVLAYFCLAGFFAASAYVLSSLL